MPPASSAVNVCFSVLPRQLWLTAPPAASTESPSTTHQGRKNRHQHQRGRQHCTPPALTSLLQFVCSINSPSGEFTSLSTVVWFFSPPQYINKYICAMGPHWLALETSLWKPHALRPSVKRKWKINWFEAFICAFRWYTDKVIMDFWNSFYQDCCSGHWSLINISLFYFRQQQNE